MSSEDDDDDTLHEQTARSSDIRHALFGGVGRVAVRDLTGARDVPPFSAVLSCVLDAGATVGRHRQTDAHEIVVCLAGHGVFIVDGDAIEARPGVVAHVRCGSVLAIENVSSENTLDYLIVKAQPQAS
jgi:quercetin dioxygenase-like cupin family protein